MLSQIWCISNSRDEEMKKNFVPNICRAKSGVISNSRDRDEKKNLFQTYVEQNLVLSQIQEMKSEMKR